MWHELVESALTTKPKHVNSRIIQAHGLSDFCVNMKYFVNRSKNVYNYAKW